MGVAMLSKADQGSLGASPMIVAETVKAAFDGEKKWDSVLWVGTHDDKCDDDSEKHVFCTEKLQLLNKKVEANILPENACTVNCRPLAKVDEAPNIGGVINLLTK